MGRRKAVSKYGGEGEGSKRRRASSNHKEDEVKEAKGNSTGGRKAAKNSKPEPAANIVNPLLMEDVIEKIFQFLICPKTSLQESSATVAKNVQTLRLVCKQWKETATRIYLLNRAPMLSFGEKWGSLPPPTPLFPRLTWKPSPAKIMQDFLDVMKSSKLIPIQRYTINDTFLVQDNQQLIKDFMHICGPHAVELCISCFKSSRKMFSRASFTDLNLMSLKKLTIDCDGLDDNFELIDVLLGAAGSLREFNFNFYYYQIRYEEEHARYLIDHVVQFVCNRIPKTVKILRLDMPLNDTHLHTLAHTELKLKEFEFNCRSVRSCEVVREFFGTQTTTLKYLKMFEKDADANKTRLSSVPLDFPRFDELLHMELDDGTVQKFSFPYTFPKLATLNIAQWHTESTFLELLNCAKQSSSLKEIHLPYRFPQAPLVKKAAQCFPNISKLHIYQSQDISETLQEAFVHFPNVEELYISFPNWRLNVDSVFSGVSEEVCRDIKGHYNFDHVINLGDVQHQPSIRNLTKLKKLVLENPDHGDVILSDFTAHFVLLKMASLMELHIKRFQMSTKYLDLLREKLTLKLDEDGRGFDGIDGEHFIEVNDIDFDYDDHDDDDGIAIEVVNIEDD